METSNGFKPINIREVVTEKSPGVAKILPGFVFRYLHKIIHIDYINELLQKYGHLTGIDFVTGIVKDFNIEENIYGLENIPDSGRFIFASNHPLGGFDGMVLMKTVYNKLGGLKFLANDVIMNISNLADFFIPLNKHGGNSRDVAKAVNTHYMSEEQMLIFPSGLASRKIKGEIMDLEWQKHFIAKSIEFKRDVIPVFIGGRNSNRFYRLAKLRKFFKIKWNLEMFFLPDETYKHRNKDVTIYFGKPIPYSTFDKSKNHKQWAQYVKDFVYTLPKSKRIDN